MAISILNDLRIRGAQLEDAQAVTDFANLCSIADLGTQTLTLDDTRREWQVPGLELDKDMRLVFAPNGQLIGYIEVWNVEEPYARPGCWGRVHPDYRGQGIGTYLLRYAEERAREKLHLAPSDAQVTLGTGVDSRVQSGIELMEHKGFTVGRRFYEMQIDMTDAPPAPQFLAGITIRTAISGQDDRAVYDAIMDAFADHWGFLPMSFERWGHFMLNGDRYDPSLWFLAMDGSEIAGMALCDPKSSHDPMMGWVDDLGVRRVWRKRGLGLALLHHAFGEFYRRGTRKVGLGVDASSLTNAVKLYERAGMHVAKTSYRYEKVLRPGKELSTQTLSE